MANKTVDELVEYSKIVLYKHSGIRVLTNPSHIYIFIINELSKDLLRVLKSATNVHSVHDIMIINEISHRTELNSVLKQILEVYKNRKIL